MSLSLFLAGIVVAHVLVWGMVRQMRRDGQRIRRYQLFGFAAMEALFGGLLLLTGSLSLLVWFGVNAAFVILATRLNPPRPTF